MADKNDGLSHLLELFKLVIALCLKENISYRQRFIHNQDLRFNIDGYSKSQPYKHTAGIGFDRLMYIIPNICKI